MFHSASGLIPVGLLIALPIIAQVQTDVASLASHPSLAAWRKSHVGEKFEPAHYDTTKDTYRVDYARRDRWCAASLGDLPVGIKRTALFYVPSPLPAALPSRPANCELAALWYEMGPDTVDSLVRELSAAWGKPNGASAGADIEGWARWQAPAAWHLSGIDVWVAREPGTNGTRGVAYARRNMPSDWDVTDRWFGSAIQSQTFVAGAVARLAALGPVLTPPILQGSNCSDGSRERGGESTNSLAAWLQAAKALTPTRRAAALLLADFDITCGGTSFEPDQLEKHLVDLGAKYATRSPQDGPDYSHNFREQAETLDPHGPAGELAGLISLTDPCFLKGKKPWPDLVIEKGIKMRSAFPASDWTPYVEFMMARAHATKLSFALGGDPEGAVYTLSPAMMQRERAAAIAQFRSFVRQKPQASEKQFAAREAWKLSAGLPPAQIHFGCSGE